jgi:hypothetical protein
VVRELVVDDHPIVHLGVERLVEAMPSIQMCTGALTAKAGVAITAGGRTTAMSQHCLRGQRVAKTIELTPAPPVAFTWIEIPTPLSLAACVDYTDPHDVHSGARRRAGATAGAGREPVRTRGTHRASCVRARMTRMTRM